MNFGKKDSTSNIQTLIREGLDKGLEINDIKAFDFEYHYNASVNVSICRREDDGVTFYEILVLDNFVCREGHFHAQHLAEMTLGKCQGFNFKNWHNLVAHLCADVVSTFLRDMQNGDRRLH